MRNRFIDHFKWRPDIEDKVFAKHGLRRAEVEECFFHPEARIQRRRDRRLLLSRTYAGQYVMIVFTFADSILTIISAREMTDSERRRFRRK
jgi:uncharacterized DUF497 family protein